MRVVDLTLPVRSGAAGIPGIALYEKHPARVAAATVVNDEQRAFLAATGVEMLEGAPAVGHMNTVINLVSHLGTHIDAPRHFYAQGTPVDELALDRLVACRAVLLDVSDLAAGEGITGDDLERCKVRPAAGEIAVIRTGWTDRAWGTPEYWSNTMYLDPSVGEWTRQFDLAAVGFDCFPEKPFWRFTLQANERGANHRCWLGAGIPMIQMLTNLGTLGLGAGERFTLTALPLRLAGMDGSPARVVGIV